MRDGIGDNGAGYIEDPAIPVSSLQMVITSEPDLRYLNGLICVLSLLGECTDPIEPKVAAALAQATEPPLTRLITLHRAVTTGRPSAAPSGSAFASANDSGLVPSGAVSASELMLNAGSCGSTSTASIPDIS